MLICVTNRRLCKGNFKERVELIASRRPHMIILREKDMELNAYTELAGQVMDICRRYNVKFAINTFYEAAEVTGAECIHIPLKLLEENPELSGRFHTGVSVHSVDEALTARRFGAEYIIAGHIFETECKKGLAPRGTDYLRNIVTASDIPVFGIGGINENNMQLIKETGAAGFCVMSELMSCSEKNFPEKLFRYK